MNFRDWEMLATLYDTKNITHAAHQLFLSQPTLTSRIKKLEDYYGTQLIMRKRRGVTFTPEGITLAEHAKKMVREQKMIEEHLNNMKDHVTGTLRVGVSHFFALHKMPKLLRIFNQKYPDVECQIVSGWSSDMHRSLVNRDVHIAFIKGDYSWQGKKRLLYEENVCVAAPWDFMWEDLPTLPRIDYYTDEQMRHTIDNWWYANYQVNPYINIRVNQVETCKEMVVHNLGYAILGKLVVEPYSNLFIKPLHYSNGDPIIRKTWMYYHRDALQLNIVRAFTDFILTIDVKSL